MQLLDPGNLDDAAVLNGLLGGRDEVAVEADLDRQDLDTKRAAEQNMAMNRFEVARNNAIVFEKKRAAEAVAAGWAYVDNYTSGTASFSTAAVSLLEALFPAPWANRTVTGRGRR